MPQSNYSLWRRFRWRYRSSLWMLPFAALFSLPQFLCLLLWMLPDWHHSTAFQVCCWLWFLQCLSLSAVMTLIVIFYRFFQPELSAAVEVFQGKGVLGVTLLLALLSLPLACISLATGHIDWAAEVLYGNTVLNGIFSTFAQKTWRYLPSCIVAGFVLYAIVIHSIPGFLCGVLLAPFAKYFNRLDWRNTIRRRPTKSAYVESLKKGYGESRFFTPQSRFVKTLCKLEIWEDAKQEFQQLQQDKTLDAKSKADLEVEIALGEGRLSDALELAKQTPKPSTQDLLQLARIYAKIGNREETAKTLSQMDLKWPNEKDIGDVYAAMGDYEAALVHYERASRMGKNNQMLCNMAATLMALGQYIDAAFVYRDAIANTPYFATAELKNLAQCYRQSGNEQAALKMETLAGTPE